MNRQKITIFLIILVLIVAACLVGIYFTRQKDVTQKNQLLTEADELLAANRGLDFLAASAKAEDIPALSEQDHIIFGDLKAPVKIIIYDNPSDLYSAQFNNIIKTASQEFGDKIVVANRLLAAPKDDLAIESAAALECANIQKQYLPLREGIMTPVLAKQYTADSLQTLVKSLELNLTKFNSCLASGKFQANIIAASLNAQNFFVFGTPTTFINGEIVTGARPMDDITNSADQPLDGLRKIIDRAFISGSYVKEE